MNYLAVHIQRILRRLGYELQRTHQESLEEFFWELHTEARSMTMSSRERQYALFKAVEYLVKSGIPGDFVECGVWRGGSAYIIAKTLLSLGSSSRQLFLYDTYAGMSEPTEKDVSGSGKASARWKALIRDGYNAWDYAPLDEVKANIERTGYPSEKVTYIIGKVEDTIPGVIPNQIALLRLDTDWYESTRHELEHLFPRLVTGGVLLLDDYGHWQGAREAVDEYLESNGISLYLNPIDYTGRIGIKM